MNAILAATLVTLLLASGDVPTAPAPLAPPRTILSDVRFDQQLGTQLSLETPFRDEAGMPVTLGACFRGKPVILALVYHECPMLCNQMLGGLVTGLKALDFTAGKEFDVVILSIAPSDTPEMASRKKRGYLARYGRDPQGTGWHFLTGTEEHIRRIADGAGYHYALDPKSGQYAHPSGIVLLTPGGVVSKYFLGIDYPTRPLRLALIEASERRIGTAVDQILLLCFHYDPSTGRYSLAVMRVLQLAGCATLVTLGLFISRSLLRERKGGLLDGAE